MIMPIQFEGKFLLDKNSFECILVHSAALACLPGLGIVYVLFK
jgi:hypothetical protein